MEIAADIQTAVRSDIVKEEVETAPEVPGPAISAVMAVKRLEELRPELESDIELKHVLEGSDQPSPEFLRGAMEVYRLAQTALTQQLKSKVERIKEVRRLRVKARRMSIKITKLLGC